jgi:hypothetical protein
MKINIGYKVHANLPSRLIELTRQDSFSTSTSICWATRNADNPEILSRLREIASAYGVKEIISTDEIPLKKIDALFSNFGKGRLPYLAFDKILSAGDVPILIDDAGSDGRTLGTWGNVFALSFSKLTGEKEPEKILIEYCRSCFGEPALELAKIFTLARRAIEKCFFVLDAVPMMDRSCWPENIDWLDAAVENSTPEDHPLRKPNSKTISEVDFEKIEALEAAHDAWRTFISIAPSIKVNGFLWLEHYLLHLKTICQALRLLAVGYFKLRANRTGSDKIPNHIFRAIRKDLFDVVCDHRAILSQFEKNSLNHAFPLADILSAFKINE